MECCHDAENTSSSIISADRRAPQMYPHFVTMQTRPSNLQRWLNKLRIPTHLRKNSPEESTERKDVLQNDQALFKLAPELWSQIISLLSLEDVVSLALTCKSLLQTIGSGPFESLKKPEYTSRRVRFLVHMIGNHPRHILCSRCGIFHKRSVLVWYPARGIRRNREKHDHCYGLCNESERKSQQNLELLQFYAGIWNIEWDIVKHVVGAHRAGSGFAEMHLSLSRDQIDIDGGHHSVRARVCESHLLMRFQTVLRVKENLSVRTLHNQEPSSIQSRCRHMAFALNSEYDCLVSCGKYLGKPFWYWSHEAYTCSIDVRRRLSACTKTCMECPSEYQLQLVGKDLVFTRWVDFGECLSEPTEEYKALSEGQISCKMWTPSKPVPPNSGSRTRDWSKIPRISTRFDYAGLC